METAADADAVLGVENVSPTVAETMGVIRTDEAGQVTRIIENMIYPPSTLVTTGCYVLPTGFFYTSALFWPSVKGEYQLSEAVDLLAHTGCDVTTIRLGERVNMNTSVDVERTELVV